MTSDAVTPVGVYSALERHNKILYEFLMPEDREEWAKVKRAREQDAPQLTLPTTEPREPTFSRKRQRFDLTEPKMPHSGSSSTGNNTSSSSSSVGGASKGNGVTAATDDGRMGVVGELAETGVGAGSPSEVGEEGESVPPTLGSQPEQPDWLYTRHQTEAYLNRTATSQQERELLGLDILEFPEGEVTDSQVDRCIIAPMQEGMQQRKRAREEGSNTGSRNIRRVKHREEE